MQSKRNSRGGARPNTGPKRGTKPRVYLRLSDEDAKSLWQLAKHRRLAQPGVTEELIVGELVRREWSEIEQSYGVTAEDMA